LLGSALGFTRDWLGFLTGCAREYGDMVFFRFFRTPVCLVNHPDLVEQVLVTRYQDFVKSKDYRVLRNALGDGLLTSEGDFWLRQRRLMQPAFHRDRIVGFAPLVTGFAGRMLDGWRDGGELDLHQEMTRLTLEIAAKVFFDADVSRDAADVGAALGVMIQQFVPQADLAFLLPDWAPLPVSRKFRRAVRRLDEIVYEMIRRRRADPAPRGDLLDLLLAARDESGNPMSDRQLRDEITTIFVAGHETTALAISWTAMLLAQNPHCATRLSEEVDCVLAGRAPTAEDIPQLRYTEMVVKESLRLYPPAWGVGRRTLRRFEIGGYSLPAGTNFLLCQWIVHRDPRFFPDPEKFDPERWREDPQRTGALARFAYFPFGGGPRVCIGASFAMMEAVLIVAAIAQRFHMTLPPDQKIELLPSVTLRPKHGLRVHLARR
jgi:cytochrome P450